MRRRLLSSLLLLLLAVGPARAAEYRIETVAEGLAFPWCIAFLPDGDPLVTLRGGELLRLAGDGAVPVRYGGVPEPYVRSQGGLFDVLPDPAFAENRLVYLSYAHGTPEANATRVVRARLGADRLEDVTPILTVAPTKDTPVHYGGKLAFLPDGTLLVTTGDGFDYREAAQRRTSLLGKTLRIHTDGSIPEDNPFADDPAAEPALWTFGHRNPQGLAVGDDGTVWLHEHGPRGGDELNRLEPGTNYGWPVATFGLDYSGQRITPYTEYPGMEPPRFQWTPSIAPSGLAWYDGDAFPAWRGDLFLGALAAGGVRRVDLEDGEVVAEETVFPELEGRRIRDVRTGPDGALWVLVDAEDGAVLRIVPAGD
ncbi:MAG: PQQ-dependent sugar dehydrogenase [Pseudomonadales bacterium]|jgi:glucose/arabinose dehydrogenase|nr:PQQ-dependent sugar dehydrogenase [Pseudomonadales bacterium]